MKCVKNEDRSRKMFRAPLTCLCSVYFLYPSVKFIISQYNNIWGGGGGGGGACDN